VRDHINDKQVLVRDKNTVPSWAATFSTNMDDLQLKLNLRNAK